MPDVASDRSYPGMRPFAEPGMSISNVGPCGQENYGNMVSRETCCRPCRLLVK